MAALLERLNQVKNTIHTNVAFRQGACDGALLRDLLRWLGGQCPVAPSEGQIEAHLAQLERRRQGLDSLTEMAHRAGQSYLAAFQLPRQFMPSYDFAEFDLGVGRMILSIDLLDAGGETGLPPEVGDLVEIFLVGAKLPEVPETLEERHRRWQLEREKLRQVVTDLVQKFDVRFVFGGNSAFFGRYVSWLEKSRTKRVPRRALPWEFLWPLTYLPECSMDGASLKALPVHFAERVGRGAIVQVFEDLQTGYEDAYREAAQTLGLRSVWELKV